MTYKSLWIFALGPLMGGAFAGLLSIALNNLYTVSEETKNQQIQKENENSQTI